MVYVSGAVWKIIIFGSGLVKDVTCLGRYAKILMHDRWLSGESDGCRLTAAVCSCHLNCLINYLMHLERY